MKELKEQIKADRWFYLALAVILAVLLALIVVPRPASAAGWHDLTGDKLATAMEYHCDKTPWTHFCANIIRGRVCP